MNVLVNYNQTISFIILLLFLLFRDFIQLYIILFL